jgi:pimeloyl-ACP methyl ester carboxylesterase
MKRELLNRVVRHAGVLLCCIALGGCGLYAANREANRYRSDMAKTLKEEITNCSTSKSKQRHALDHRINASDDPDCYSAYITGTSRALKEAPPPDPGMKSDPKAAVGDVWSPQVLAQPTSAAAVLGQVAWPAVLSKIVYRRYLGQASRGSCGVDPEFDPLKRISEGSKGPGDWEYWSDNGIGCRGSASGLFYETFVYRLRSPGTGTDAQSALRKGQITQAFIVFRGTENFKGQFWPDWSTNAAMALDIAPAQFKEVRSDLKSVIRGLQADSPGVRIYTAGHSLGGSMAQLAAYLSKDVRIAYAFNSSPVSGWTWLRELQGKDPKAIENDDPPIIRVMQEDELAGFLRFFSNAANSTVRRTGRTDIELDFPSSRDVLERSKSSSRIGARSSLHSITLLACNLAARVEKGARSPFNFSEEQATIVLSERDGKYSVKDEENTEGTCQVVENDADCKIDWTGRGTTCTRVKSASSRQLSAN